VFHCFPGDATDARRCLDVGGVLSISGIVTFESADDVRAAVALAPLDRLMVETDSPFLTPVPHRGRPNLPGYLPLVGAGIAAVKGLGLDEVAAATWETASSFYALDAG
jgi:TatD DNase family protein